MPECLMVTGNTPRMIQAPETMWSALKTSKD
jgi:hypothetical protein